AGVVDHDHVAASVGDLPHPGKPGGQTIACVHDDVLAQAGAVPLERVGGPAVVRDVDAGPARVAQLDPHVVGAGAESQGRVAAPAADVAVGGTDGEAAV